MNAWRRHAMGLAQDLAREAREAEIAMDNDRPTRATDAALECAVLAHQLALCARVADIEHRR